MRHARCRSTEDHAPALLLVRHQVQPRVRWEGGPDQAAREGEVGAGADCICLLYTSPSPRD
eukprot:1492984-Alexandrium_andersonii.AAC.1